MPCFIWIFHGAPHIEYRRGRKALSPALCGITADGGVVLNLAVGFPLHTLFATVDEVSFGALRLLVPDLVTLDPMAALITVAAFLVLFRYRASMITTVAGAAPAGLVYYVLAFV